ncbi:MAG: DUF4340 domain-containing protein [Verrucomicrobia bacterium]|nr:DUF4340 domain-containing protein [Verrucomicrobiota bacterium]MBU1733722.1 DUF4340 domain-containing protein [Verrucomicrobiota bacterium]MBU1855902.1 DUF4340 domain-containing protein [Verrucomicrobiota bacterium]
MKTRNLILLVVLAGALIGWAVWTLRPQPKPGIALIGTKVLPNLPINRVNKIVLITTDNTLTLAKFKGIWTVANRFNYPAAFDKIADGLLQLSEMKVGQVITASESQKGAFNLLNPVGISPGRKEQAGTRVELRDENDGLIATLLIGKPFMRASPDGSMQGPLAFGNYPDGQYVQTADGRVILVGQTLDRLTDDVKNWLANEFVNVAANDIQNITVTAPDRAPINLVRSKNGEPFTLEGLKEEEGTLDTAKVNQISGALNILGFDDIAAPTLSPKETGLEHPVVFEAQTRQGQIYTLRIGNTLTNDTFDRYVQVAVAWKAPAEPDDRPQDAKTNTLDAAKADESAKRADEAKVLNDRLVTWTFILKSYRAEPFLIKRTELIKKTEPPGGPKNDDRRQTPDTRPED